MPEETKKCPFCGRDDRLIQYGSVKQVGREAKTIEITHCTNCGASAPTEVWQQRPLEDALEKRVEELEGDFDRGVQSGIDRCIRGTR